MPTLWLSRLQRWRLHPPTCLNMPGATHTAMEAVLSPLPVWPSQGALLPTARAAHSRSCPQQEQGSLRLSWRWQTQSSRLRGRRQVALSQGGCKAIDHTTAKGWILNPSAHSRLKRVNPWSDQDRKQSVPGKRFPLA